MKEVIAAGGQIHAVEADVRDVAALTAALNEGVAKFGGGDIVLANAGIAPMSLHPTDEEWQEVLAPHSIRVNTVHPTGVATPMMLNPVMEEVLSSDEWSGAGMADALPVPMVEPVDISNAIMWLVSDDARYVTGVALPVDAGFVNKR